MYVYISKFNWYISKFNWVIISKFKFNWADAPQGKILKESFHNCWNLQSRGRGFERQPWFWQKVMNVSACFEDFVKTSNKKFLTGPSINYSTITWLRTDFSSPLSNGLHASAHLHLRFSQRILAQAILAHDRFSRSCGSGLSFFRFRFSASSLSSPLSLPFVILCQNGICIAWVFWAMLKQACMKYLEQASKSKLTIRQNYD